MNYELLNKWSLTEEELEEVYNMQFEEPEPEWLAEFKHRMEEIYGIRLIAVEYRKDLDCIIYYMYDYIADSKKLPAVERSYLRSTPPALRSMLLELCQQEPDITAKTEIRAQVCFVGAARHTLIKQKGSELEDIVMNELRKHSYKIFKVFWNFYPIARVFRTKEEAKRFLLSEIRPKLIHSCYEKLKTYDKYEVLSEDAMFIFVDYQENYNSINMWSRWARDTNAEERHRWEDKIIEE